MDKEIKLASAQSVLCNSICSIRMEPHPPPLQHRSAPPSQTLLLGGWDEEYEPVCMTEAKVQESNAKGV